ncbi:UDP-glucose--hexose-1-phosphate uridylyltransferase [Paenibacillus marinisediminis]
MGTMNEHQVSGMSDGDLQAADTCKALSFSEEVCETIEQLIQYARAKGMIGALDCPDVRNKLLNLFRLPEPYDGYCTEYGAEQEAVRGLQDMLALLLDYGYAIGLIPDNSTTQRDLLDASIMGMLMPRPSEAANQFWQTARTEGIVQATRHFYNLSIDSNYIRMDRVRKNVEWEHESEYGPIQMTINVSKPEKSPQEIALARQQPSSSYPQCLLCADNVGFAGHANHPARQNLRIIPLTLNEEAWYFQYSPYVYYNEHSIVFKSEHVPMKLTEASFKRLLEFTEQFPHYFIGSNADLPIVGGSILSHDHFQAGCHTFPIEQACADHSFTYPQFAGVRVSIVRWPMSVLRLAGEDRDTLLQAVNTVFEAWKQYSDPSVGIYAYSGDGEQRTPHNTVTPIVRRRGTAYEVDVVLRNNRTSEQHPEGIYHPHREMHHIKRENIGLIEVMGLAILPPRLLQSIAGISALLTGAESWEQRKAQMNEHDELTIHRDWIDMLVERYGCGSSAVEAERIVKTELGRAFVEILGHAGVYKRDEEGQRAFIRFTEQLGLFQI